MSEHPILIDKTTLRNGIRVLSEVIPGMRSISVGVLIDAGSKDEADDQRGYAHFLEHMIFQGTGSRDARQIAEMMTIGGGAIGAFTTRDYTVYYATVLDDYLTFALEVLGDMLCNSILPEEGIARQRGVILNELATAYNPIETVNNLLKTSLWPTHPIGYPTIGTAESIEKVTQASLRRFMQTHYLSNQVVVAAAGRVELEDFAAQVEDSFRLMKPGDLPSKPSTPDTLTGQLIATPFDMQQVYFALAWPAPSYTDDDRYKWHVFSSVIGSGPTSRLYTKLREERGLVYQISSQYQAYGTAGALVIEGATMPQALVPVLANILIELVNLSETLVNLDEHHRVVQSMVSQHYVSGDSTYTRMSRLALQENYFGRVVSSKDISAGIQSVVPDEVQGVAQQICEIGLPTTVLVGPVNAELLHEISSMLADFGDLATPQLLVNGANVLVQ
ncbi:MAG: insulinase family protein [Chloroflexi bacterium]|nr:insulinase family protein [Chloroflexota bacterium]